MRQLPNKFVQTIKSVHKENGEQWLNCFNKLIEECEERWDIQFMPPFPLSYNFVAPAVRKAQKEVVVKLGIRCCSYFPIHPVNIKMLRFWKLSFKLFPKLFTCIISINQNKYILIKQRFNQLIKLGKTNSSICTNNLDRLTYDCQAINR